MLAEGDEISRGLEPRGEAIGESTTRVVTTSSRDDDCRVTGAFAPVQCDKLGLRCRETARAVRRQSSAGRCA
jgi:hypothetical protein